MDLKRNSLFTSPATIRLNVDFKQTATSFAIQKLIVTREYSLNYLLKNQNVYWQNWKLNYIFGGPIQLTTQQFAIFGSSFSDNA